jgi:hypothetical protein
MITVQSAITCDSDSEKPQTSDIRLKLKMKGKGPTKKRMRTLQGLISHLK